MVAGDAGPARGRTRGRIPHRRILRGQLPLRMPPPGGIGDERPTDLHEIGEPLPQQVLGLDGRAEESERRDLDAGRVSCERSDPPRIRRCGSRGARAIARRALDGRQVQMQGTRVAAPAPGQIVHDPGRVQAARDGRSGIEVDALRHRILAGKLHADGEVRAALRPQRAAELGEEARPALDPAAVAVRAQVRARGEELVDEMTVPRRDLDAREAELAQAARRRREVPYQVLHLARRQRARQHAAQVIGDDRRRDRLDLGADEQAAATRVLQLRDEMRAFRTYRRRPRLEAGEVRGIVRAHLVRGALRGQQVHRLGDEQRRPAPRPRGVVGDEARRDPPRLGIARGDRRVRDAVVQPQHSQRDRLEEADGRTALLDRVAGHPVPLEAMDWRARRDSNSRPSGSKPDALSN